MVGLFLKPIARRVLGGDRVNYRVMVCTRFAVLGRVLHLLSELNLVEIVTRL